MVPHRGCYRRGADEVFGIAHQGQGVKELLSSGESSRSKECVVSSFVVQRGNNSQSAARAPDQALSDGVA